MISVLFRFSSHLHGNHLLLISRHAVLRSQCFLCTIQAQRYLLQFSNQEWIVAWTIHEEFITANSLS